MECSAFSPSSNYVVYCWILHCIDHFSKFTWAYPLENKSAKEVVVKLRQLFFTFGPPRLLHSDNGSEFVANVILEPKTVFPNLCFIRGRPRHPQSQGCIERANGVLSLSLGKWLQTNNTTHWSEGLLPVVYGINTRTCDTTKATPYEIMFGQHPRGDSEFWKIVKDQDIVDEEHLPSPIESIQDNDVDKEISVSTSKTIDNIIDNIDHQESLNSNVTCLPSPLNASISQSTSQCLLDLSPSTLHVSFQQPLIVNDNPVTENLISFDSPPSPQRVSTTLFDLHNLTFSPVTCLSNKNNVVLSDLQSISTAPATNSISKTNCVSQPSSSFKSYNSSENNPIRHESIWRKAQDNYLDTANKRRKAYDEHLSNLAEMYKKMIVLECEFKLLTGQIQIQKFYHA
ncbi:unnamed protein product [Didymodactylos carnosus]|uniref:Integrase catalytic domain-containing protein n=1 Tax=Didymodactylos carnosus TaxID=1234261 RepID=A0A815RRA6_9BILA|nr:unnamed protein product [Didymodactylos carnosus]CAF4345862.1 unnamed protein product [Didymodactylos carnosus]